MRIPPPKPPSHDLTPPWPRSDLENGGDLLKDAAKRHPSAQTLCQYARFLYNVKKEYTAAWQLFEKALVADSTVRKTPHRESLPTRTLPVGADRGTRCEILPSNQHAVAKHCS